MSAAKARPRALSNDLKSTLALIGRDFGQSVAPAPALCGYRDLLCGDGLGHPDVNAYSIRYMLGTCLLRTFVIEDEKREYIENLEASIQREQRQREALSTAWRLAYTDALTGAKSKLACAEWEKEIDQSIASARAGDLAVVVFDVNGLMQINDTLGHKTGNRYIIDACRLIGEVFQHSPVYRVGGDEFVAILQNEDYGNRKELLSMFNRRIEENKSANRVVVAAGLADYIPDTDRSFERVFRRADREMYRQKEVLKHSEILTNPEQI